MIEVDHLEQWPIGIHNTKQLGITRAGDDLFKCVHLIIDVTSSFILNQAALQ